MLLASLASGNIKAQDPSTDLEEVNVYDSLNSNSGSSAPADTSSDVQMSSLEEQDDLQSLKEDIGDVVFEKDKPVQSAQDDRPSTLTTPTVMEGTAPTDLSPKAGTLNATSPKGQNVTPGKDEKAEIIADE